MALTKLTEGANKSLQCAEFNSLSFVMDRISEVEPDDTAHIPSMSLQVTRVLSILTQVALTGTTLYNVSPDSCWDKILMSNEQISCVMITVTSS